MIKRFQQRVGQFSLGTAFVSAALILCACGQSSTSQALVGSTLDPQTHSTATSAPIETQAPLLTRIPPTTPTAPSANSTSLPLRRTATQIPQLSRFADAAPPAPRTPLPAVAAACPTGCESPPAGCVVKGTISRAGYKVYILPGQSGYAAQPLNPASGERWFCTIAEARAAGWLPIKVVLPAGHAP